MIPEIIPSVYGGWVVRVVPYDWNWGWVDADGIANESGPAPRFGTKEAAEEALMLYLLKANATTESTS